MQPKKRRKENSIGFDSIMVKYGGIIHQLQLKTPRHPHDGDSLFLSFSFSCFVFSWYQTRCLFDLVLASYFHMTSKPEKSLDPSCLSIIRTLLSASSTFLVYFIHRCLNLWDFQWLLLSIKIVINLIWKCLFRAGIPGDGRCLFRSVVYGACLRTGKPSPTQTQQKELADELRARVLITLSFFLF